MTIYTYEDQKQAHCDIQRLTFKQFNCRSTLKTYCALDQFVTKSQIFTIDSMSRMEGKVKFLRRRKTHAELGWAAARQTSRTFPPTIASLRIHASTKLSSKAGISLSLGLFLGMLDRRAPNHKLPKCMDSRQRTMSKYDHVSNTCAQKRRRARCPAGLTH